MSDDVIATDAETVKPKKAKKMDFDAPYGFVTGVPGVAFQQGETYFNGTGEAVGKAV